MISCRLYRVTHIQKYPTAAQSFPTVGALFHEAGACALPLRNAHFTSVFLVSASMLRAPS